MFPSKVLGRGEGEEKADGRESHTVPKMYSLGRGRAQCPGGKHSACVYCARAFFFSPLWYLRLHAGDDSVQSILESRNI